MNLFGRSAQEQRHADEALIPGTNILKNKLGITDPQRLEQAERMIVANRLAKGLPEQAKTFDARGIKAIHAHILGPVYDWAGQYRNYTTGRADAPFARPEFIAPQLDQLHKGLQQEKFLRGLSADQFAHKAAGAVNHLNAIHPFIDGNGRTQRVWLRNLAEQAGHQLIFRKGDRDAWNDASRHGFHNSDDRMATFIGERLTPARTLDQAQYIAQQRAIADMAGRKSKDRLR